MVPQVPGDRVPKPAALPGSASAVALHPPVPPAPGWTHHCSQTHCTILHKTRGSEGDTHLNAPKPSLYPTPHLYGWPHHAAVLPCPQAGRWQAGVQQGWGHGRATLPHWRSWIQTALSPGVHGGVPLLPPALVHPYCQLVPSCPSSSPSVGMALGLQGGWEILRSQDGHLHGQWEPIMLNPIEYLSKMGRGWDSRDPTYCSMPTLIPVLPNPTPLGTPRGHTQQWKQAAHPPAASWRPAGQMDVPPAAWPR